MESTARMNGIEGEVRMVLPGEPYEPAGKRLVFTSWLYVSQGGFAWLDGEGKGLPAITWQTAAGPFEAGIRFQDEARGIRLVAQKAERRGPLLEREKPWEARGLSLSTVLKEDGLYRAWGPCEDAAKMRRVAYYESEDGLTWKRPRLGLAEYEGDRQTNLLELSPGKEGNSLWGWMVFRDPSAPPSERYKAIKEARFDPETFARYRSRWPNDWLPTGYRKDFWYGSLGAVSPDGLQWKVLPDPLFIEHCDTQNIAYYDTRLGKYVIYTRSHTIGVHSAKSDVPWGVNSWGGNARRAIGRTESADFHHFPPSKIILSAGPDMSPSESLYTNGRTTIPGCPDLPVMFPTIYDGPMDDTTSIGLASSPDGLDWNWVPGPRVLETAPFGQWDGGCLFAHPELNELADGSFGLPYTGYVYPHKYPRGAWQFLPGMAIWPRGRLIALAAPEEGRFTTVGFVPPTGKLALNVRTKRAGCVRVEAVEYPSGKVLPGRSFAEMIPIVGDHSRAPVTWGAACELGVRDGQAIRLRLRLEKAELFSLEFV